MGVGGCGVPSQNGVRCPCHSRQSGARTNFLNKQEQDKGNGGRVVRGREEGGGLPGLSEPAPNKAGTTPDFSVPCLGISRPDRTL